MELLLALAMIITAIIFGALISLGNERQRRAIDELREQVVLWAIQDLRIKREQLARDVRVENPLEWLNRIAAKVCGYDLKLHVIEAFDEPRTLVCSTGNGSEYAILTPVSPDDIRRFRNDKRGRLSRIAAQSPLLRLPRKATGYEISTLNGGMVFDLELALVWTGLTGQRSESMERLWIYISV